MAGYNHLVVEVEGKRREVAVHNRRMVVAAAAVAVHMGQHWDMQRLVVEERS